MGISFRFYFFLFLVLLLKFFCNNVIGVLANVAVDYFRLINRHGNTALIHVLSYHPYLP